MKNIRSNIFDINTIKRPARSGSLMVAEPFLRERYFLHAVVSVIDAPDNGEGTMGVVLNNKTALNLHEILDGLDSSRPVPVYCGGPMSQDRLFFIHTLGRAIIPDAQEYAPGLWVGGDFDSIIRYINAGYPTDGVVRFFLGYSGWGVGQLDAELNDNVWAVAESNIDITPAELLSLHGDRLWHRVVRAMGPGYRLWKLHPSSASAN